MVLTKSSVVRRISQKLNLFRMHFVLLKYITNVLLTFLVSIFFRETNVNDTVSFVLTMTVSYNVHIEF